MPCARESGTGRKQTKSSGKKGHKARGGEKLSASDHECDGGPSELVPLPVF